MDMVGHQTIRMHCHSIRLAVFGQSLQVGLIVSVCDESLLPLISPNDHVIEQAGSKEARAASHADPNISKKVRLSRLKGLTPSVPLLKEPGYF